MSRWCSLVGGMALLLVVSTAATQQPPGPGGFGPGGFGGPTGQQQRKLVKQFDKDGDGRLNTEERKAAREFLKKQGGGRGGFGPGGPGGRGPGGFGRPQPGQLLPE